MPAHDPVAARGEGGGDDEEEGVADALDAEEARGRCAPSCFSVASDRNTRWRLPVSGTCGRRRRRRASVAAAAEEEEAAAEEAAARAFSE